ncbi:MarR family winged helix-turn-helix transcriptional regulator [Actinomycetospora endophytica]|uniref:MarR family winged helix-turn-helix transcriptional regulator n=1 Tax=Actinomycetospora endophytica TaxID=2291215 RepID=A0ABS8P430_9PSEU|nr:MarR family winged helix-turn-helix transcriptional regulator [Actinomycetospora endophytica]MCD2193019.1 MarR family winged helix-turn-helix transcriptional regulator [Actinomycetospora endophytica]
MADATQDRDEPWLSSEQLRDWAALVAMLMTLPVSLDAQLKKDAGLNLFEYHVLVELAEAPGRTRVMTSLAAHTRGSLSRLSHAVSRLEAAGWVQRRACGGAGRRTEAHLTPEGWRKLQESAPGHVRQARRLVVDALTPDQLEDLGTAARRIVAATDPEVAATLLSRDRDAASTADDAGQA